VPNNKVKHKCTCGKSYEDILVPILDNGRQLIKTPVPSKIRKFVLGNIKDLPMNNPNNADIARKFL